MDTPVLLAIPDRDESLPTRRIPIERKSFRERPISMRLSRFRYGTYSLIRESYRFPNKQAIRAITRFSRLFVFVAQKTPSLAAPDRAGNASGKAEITPFDRRTIIHIVATSLPAASSKSHA
jgi:hypothetical protein